MAEPIRILLADDHALIRAGLRALLAGEPDFALVGEATTGDEVRALCATLLPDVLLLDLRMPGPPATETVPWVRAHCPATRVVILTAHREDAWVRGLLDLGAAGYVLKDDAEEAVVRAVRTVVAGDIWLSPAALAVLLRPAAGPGPDALTPRERTLLVRLAAGHSNKEIAVSLHLSEQTISNYLTTLYAKLGVTSRTAAVARARELGLA